MDSLIPDKANRVLNVILLGLLLILIRVWYLATVQHDEYLERSRRPKRRIVIERVERATIRDRFNIPMALNKIQYNAAICYADIRQIPNFRWEKDENGKKVRRVPERVEYIKKLSAFLGKELNLDPQKIEDTIHGSASLFPHTPFVIKEDLTEKEYYRLRLLEKDWIGISMERGSKRYYPMKKTASDVIGFMGAISSKEYYGIAQEISFLQTYLSEREAGNTPMLPKGFHNPFQVRERLKQLQEKAYTINDFIGKTGVETTFDSELRGYAGKKTYEIDIKGNTVCELPGSHDAIAGQRLLLSLSSELQEYAEQLLTEHEKLREVRDDKGQPSLSAPWIKGGAIVAMDPKTGEVLALASYPRVDLNDFIPSKIHQEQERKKANLNKWLENETYIGDIWDGKRVLERDRYDASHRMHEETIPLTLEKYYEAILSSQCSAREAMNKIARLSDVLFLQQEIEKLLEASGQTDLSTLLAALYSQAPHHPSRIAVAEKDIADACEHLMQPFALTASSKRFLDHYLGSIPYNDDKLLVIDLCRMLVNKERFTPELGNKVGQLSLAHYRDLTQAALSIQHFLKPFMKEWFHAIDFQNWRTQYFKEHLKEKRKEERKKKRYARPYTEYLDLKEKELFKTFWDTYRWIATHCFLLGEYTGTDPCLTPYIQRFASIRASSPLAQQKADLLKNALAALSCEDQLAFLKTMRSFEEMDRPLFGHYRSVRNHNGVQLEKHLAAAFYPLLGFGYGRSQAFRQSTPQGSVFKVIVAYQALLERYQALKEKNAQFSDMNPLTIIDDLKWNRSGSNDQILGYTLDGKPITRMYKGGKLPRSSHPNIGKIDIVGAIEQSSNIYFSLLAAEHIQDPSNLLQAARQLGFGEKSGIELPGEIAGTLPDDVIHDRTGLYSLAIGQHTLIVTPLQTAIMMAALANNGHILKPTIVQVIAGSEPLREARDPFANYDHRFQEPLGLIGIDFPLFTSLQAENAQARVWYSAPEVKRSLSMPDSIRTPLIEGMQRVMTKGTGRPEIIRSLYQNPQWKRNYLDLRHQLIGKTGTAEILFKQALDAETPAKIHNHIWFAGAAFTSPSLEEKDLDLVVAVYLRFSEAGGKEAAPLAAEIIKKWREIRAKHGNSFIHK